MCRAHTKPPLSLPNPRHTHDTRQIEFVEEVMRILTYLTFHIVPNPEELFTYVPCLLLPPRRRADCALRPLACVR
jgi:hypothetical protein